MPVVNPRGRMDPTLQLPKSRARRLDGRTRLALTGAAAFLLSLLVGLVALESSLAASASAAAGLHARSPRAMARVAARTLDIDEPAALVRLVAMDQPRARRASARRR